MGNEVLRLACLRLLLSIHQRYRRAKNGRERQEAKESFARVLKLYNRQRRGREKIA